MHHPLIRRRIEERLIALSNAGTKAVVVQVPLLLQAGWRNMVDEVWAVTAPEQDIVTRLTARRGLSVEEAERRIEAQGPREAFVEGADVVIGNDGSFEALRARARELWAERIESKGEGYDSKS